MRMRREPCFNRLTQLTEVIREGDHLGPEYPGIDKQHTGLASHDNGIALHELTLLDQHTLHDLPQHGRLLPLVVATEIRET
jgi:hypothetical protein